MSVFRIKVLTIATLVSAITTFSTVNAGEADVLKVDASCDKKSLCTFSVKVEHDDQGWQHYANRWEILSLSGEVLATRELAHPHVNEQPFTRSLNNVLISKAIKTVIVRAHDSVHGFGGKEITVSLEKSS